MLISENQMSDNTGALLWDAHRGLCFHLSGAATRLGRRTLKWTPDGAQFEGPNKSFASVIVAPPGGSWTHEQLSSIHAKVKELNASLNTAQESIHGLFVLPKNTSVDLIEKTRTLFRDATVFLSDPVFGPKDEGLFDELHSRPELAHAPTLHRLILAMPHAEPARLVNLADLAGIVLSAIDNSKVKNRTLRIDGIPITLSEVIQLWESLNGDTGGSTWIQVKSKVFGVGALKSWPKSQNDASPLVQEAGRFQDFLPAPLSSWPRHFQKLHDLKTRSPKIETLFPPGRAL